MKNQKGNRAKKKSRSNRRTPLRIVGIGASAGGLEALRDFVGALPPNAPFTYIIAQHVSPTHLSLLMNLLAPMSKLPVQDLCDQQRPEPGFVYITPPNRDVTIRQGVLYLTEPEETVGPKPSINRFFHSLAQELGEHAIAVILSGTGSDGAAGVRAIKAEGGITIVQEPATAKYDGMPKSALRTGSVDLVMPPDQIGGALERLLTAPLEFAKPDETAEEDNVKAMIATVRRHTGFNLNDYKRTTVLRRISRRLSILGLSSFPDYLSRLRDDRAEALALMRDTLISVTSFFRDAEAFTSLEKVIRQLVEKGAKNEVLRCWVAGCATGEEVYTLAMLFADAVGACEEGPQFLVFATDLDAEAVEQARTGRYSLATLEIVPETFRSRYFEIVGDQCRVRKSLKQRVVFARQNVIDDPPFSRLDLISCRNLLIYLNPPVQTKLLELFHYALNPGGYLFLGKSESIELHRDLFSAIDRTARIYQRREGVSHYTLPVTQGAYSQLPDFRESPETVKTRSERLAGQVSEALAQRYAPPSIVLAEDDTVKYLTGDLKPFLCFPQGQASMCLFEMVDAALRPELRALVYRCRRDQQDVHGSVCRVMHGGQAHNVRPLVALLAGDRAGWLVLSFEPVSEPLRGERAPIEGSEQDTLIIAELERELAHTRAHLQTVVEELETSNEELQSLNEELQSSNEELQSTNQELQTANEELQSTNEELLTVNDELQIKSAELGMTAMDLANVKESLRLPLIVVDKNLLITQRNEAIEQLVVIDGDLEGQSLTSVAWRVELPSIGDRVRAVMASGQTHEQVIADDGKRVYEMSVMPYRAEGKRIDGAILLFQDITSQHRAHEALRESEQRYALVLEGANDGLWDWNIETGQTFISQRYKALLGYSGDEHEVQSSHEVWLNHHLHPDDKERVLEALRASLQGDSPYQALEYRLRQKSGDYLWVSSRGVVVRNEAGKPVRMAGSITDITEQKQSEEKLALAASVFDNTLDGIMVTDAEGIILQVNKAFSRITGYSPDEIIGNSPRVLRSDRHDEAFYAELWRSLRDEGAWQGEIWNRHKNSRVFPLWQTISSVRNPDGRIRRYIATYYDITEQKLSEERIYRLAHYDVVTKLPNRLLFVDRLHHALERSKREGMQMAVFFMDLDHFKTINDTLGHPTGDILLQQVAEKLSQCLRRQDTVARIGGDEFTILLENIKDIAAVETVSRKILHTLAKPFCIGEQKTFISGSIGISVYPNDGSDVDALLKNADLAMYRAKELGRNRYQFYARDMAEEAAERLHLQNALRQAMGRQEFLLHYQPLTHLEDRSVVGAEALIRWQRPAMGLISPDKFIPLAEETREIDLIGEWVLRTACGQLRQWLDAGFTEVRLAVNISGQQIKRGNLADIARKVIEETRCPAELVDLEITESCIMREVEQSIQTLKCLRELGFELAIDDFGTGYSSLSYLKQIPVTKLKVDRSFIRDIPQDSNNKAIAKAIIGLGKSLGLTVVAEGIETAAQEAFLLGEGCQQGQGYFYSRPVPPNDFKEILRGQPPAVKAVLA
ncbi:MAG: EAL domain-containing protein [Gammaproteobacteria bacterium]